MTRQIEKKQAHSFYFFAYVLLAIMIANASYLSFKYLNFYYSANKLNAFDCADDCDSVMMSEYSMFFGVPVPVYGLAYFLAITIFFILLTNYKSKSDTWLYKISHLLIASDKYKFQQSIFEIFLIMGCGFAIWFLYILYFVLEMICKFCLLSHSALILFTLTYFFLLKRFKFRFDD